MIFHPTYAIIHYIERVGGSEVEDMNRKSIAGILLLITYCVFLVAVVLNFNSVISGFNKLIAVASPIIIGFCIAFLLDRPFNLLYELLERLALKAKPKAQKGLKVFFKILSMLAVYLLFLALISLILTSIIPEIGNSIAKFADNIQTYINNFKDLTDGIEEYFTSLRFWPDKGETDGHETGVLFSMINDYISDLLTQIPSLIESFLPKLYGITKSVASSVVNIFLGIAFSIYMLAGKDRIYGQIRRFFTAYLPKKVNDAAHHVIGISSEMFRSFVNGRILDAIIVGLLCFIGMSIFGFQYPLLISVVVAVTNVIPVFGPFLGAIPSIFLLLLVEPMQAVWFTVFIIVLQQLDGNFIGPKIVGNSIGMPTIWVMVAVVIGGGTLGVFGMLVGVPAFAVVYRLVSEGVNRRLSAKKSGCRDGLTESSANNGASSPEDVLRERQEASGNSVEL